jgi:hypothetical protein
MVATLTGAETPQERVRNVAALLIGAAEPGPNGYRPALVAFQLRDLQYMVDKLLAVALELEAKTAATRNDYDVWKCAECGREVHQRAMPHRPPACCGTGMWYQHGYTGPLYVVSEPEEGV